MASLNEELQRRAVDAAHIGQDIDGMVHGHASGEFDELERTAPAYQTRSMFTRPRRRGNNRQGHPRLAAYRKLSGDDLRRLDIAALLRDRLETGRPPEVAGGNRQRGCAALADIEPIGRRNFVVQEPWRKRQCGIACGDEQNPYAVNPATTATDFDRR